MQFQINIPIRRRKVLRMVDFESPQIIEQLLQKEDLGEEEMQLLQTLKYENKNLIQQVKDLTYEIDMLKIKIKKIAEDPQVYDNPIYQTLQKEFDDYKVKSQLQFQELQQQLENQNNVSQEKQFLQQKIQSYELQIKEHEEIQREHQEKEIKFETEKKKHAIEIQHFQEDLDEKYIQFDELNKQITILLQDKEKLLTRLNKQEKDKQINT